MFELEIFVLLIIALFFSFIYEDSKRSREPMVWAGIVGSFTWIILSLVFFIGRALSGMTTYVVGLFFSGIGTIYIVRWMVDQSLMKTLDRRLEDDTD